MHKLKENQDDMEIRATTKKRNTQEKNRANEASVYMICMRNDAGWREDEEEGRGGIKKRQKNNCTIIAKKSPSLF